MESKILRTIFKREPPKEHSCQVWSKLAQRFGRRCLKEWLTMHDEQQTHGPPKSSPLSTMCSGELKTIRS